MARRGSRLAAGALAVALVGGCGPGDDSSSTAASLSPSPAAETTATVPESEWLTATVEVAFPDGLAATDDAVFVKTDDGHVVRIDAASAEVVGDVRIDTSKDAGRYCQGIGSDGDSLWACSAGLETTDVYRLDPETLEVTAKVAVDKLFDQLTLPVVAGRVWVLTGTGDRVTVIDAETADTTVMPLGRRCFQLAATGTRVYATCALTDEVVALDAATGEVVASSDVPNPTNVAALGDDVWVSGGNGIVRLSADLEPRASYDGVTAGLEGDIAATSEAVWVRQPEGFLFRIDPATDRVVAQYAIDPVPSGGSVLVTADAVWLTSFDDNLVHRLDPAA